MKQQEGIQARRRFGERCLNGAREDVTRIQERLIQYDFDASFIKDDASFADFGELVRSVKANIEIDVNNVCVFLHFSAHGLYDTIEQDTIIHFTDGPHSLKETVRILQELINVNDLKLIITVDACRGAADEIIQGNERLLRDNVLVIYCCRKSDLTFESGSGDDFARATIFSSAIAANISRGYSTEVFFDNIERTMQNQSLYPDREGQCDFVF